MTYRSTRDQLTRARLTLAFINGGFTATIAIGAIWFILIFLGVGTHP